MYNDFAATHTVANGITNLKDYIVWVDKAVSGLSGQAPKLSNNQTGTGKKKNGTHDGERAF